MKLPSITALSSRGKPSHLNLLTLLPLLLWGCPEDITAVDIGVPAAGEEVQGGSDEGLSDGTCFSDDECERGQYCADDAESGVGTCVEGCRVEPTDSCSSPGSRKVCDESSRTCVLSCEEDSDCFDDQYCAEGLCQAGCRVLNEGEGSNCPDTDQGPQYCDPESRECLQGGICCDLDDLCSISPQRSCEQIGGEILLGVFSCEPNPCRALCSRDTQCPSNEFCADFGRCAPGCRVNDPDGCPANLSCHPEQNECVNLICDLDDECPDWQYCAFEGRCRDGCREGQCPDGFSCDSSHVCRRSCEGDNGCEESQYCDRLTGRCRPQCDVDTHQGCTADEACVDGECVIGCADDRFERMGDNEPTTAPIIEWLIGEEGGARSSGPQNRVLCVGDEDWIRVTIAEGERLELYLESRPSVGPLLVSLIGPAGDILVESEPWAERQAIRYPAFNEGGAAGEYLIKVTAMTQLMAHPYLLEVRAAPNQRACFSDPNDPSDDNVAGAQQLGLTPALRFTETADGDLCFGDRDLYCFPMSMSDGLSVIVDSPRSCADLNIQLAPSGIFELPPNNFEGYTAQEGVSDESESKRYELRLDPETQAFTNDDWCLSLASQGDCEGYEISATFNRRQLVCSDLREPNNQIPQATRLDDNGPLADGMGSIPNNQDLNLNENLFLCQGDRDIFSIQSAAGDAWQAWIIDDSDAADDLLGSRGTLTGELKVRFLNAEGAVVGDSAIINPRESDQMMIQAATAISAVNEPLYIEVYGVEDSAGPYQLYLRRTPSDGACSQDVNEPTSRDDELNPVSQLRVLDDQSLGVTNGYLCDPIDGQDEDWYTFEVAEANTRMCFKSSFRHRDGNINVELFQIGNLAQGDQCATHADCRANQMNSSCINRRCRAPIARANSQDDGEMLHFPSLETQAGRYYARVYSPEAAENAYQLNLTLVPPTNECQDDRHEGATSNNRAQDATRFGSGRVELCDSWLCQEERVGGDWYEIVVPASAHRTVHVAFESQQGRLTLSAVDASNLNGQVIDSPRSQSRNVHCINIIAGARPASIKLQVAGDIFNANQNRLDYLFRVVPTNLGQNIRGACDELSGGLFTETQWPTLDLRD